MNNYYLSAERLAELKLELETLKSTTRHEIAEDLKRAKEYGDLSENSEYADAKDRQALIEVRIIELEELLKRAVIIQKTEGGDTVTVGSTVTAKKGDVIVKYMIVGSSESNPAENKVSNESPLGKAFLEKKVGDDAIVETPGGKVTYQITKIE